MDLGDVFLWRNYPFAVTGKIKDRWFLYLGTYKEDPFSDVVMLIPTATTQLHHFEAGGSRHGHSVVMISASEGYGFEADCVLDFDEVFYDTPKSDFDRYAGDMTIKGKISSNKKMKEIYEAIIRARDVDKIIKISIRNNFKDAGIKLDQ